MLLGILISGLVVAAVSPSFLKHQEKWAGRALGAYPLALFCYFAVQAFQHSAHYPIIERTEWGARAGIDLVFRLDALSMVFALLITGIGSLIFFYSSAYFHGLADKRKFYSLCTLFMTAMLGSVLSENLILLFVFWELTSVTSYFLIGFNHEEKAARTAALAALLVTNLGGLAMLAGFLLVGRASGSFEITEIIANLSFLTADPYFTLSFILVLLGAFTKSAQFPFHFWLPGAMVAPTPVSAYLHSATMVKLGVFLLLRLAPVFSHHPYWGQLLPAVGFFTLLYAGPLALLSHDFKKLLAYTTLSSLGLMVGLAGFIRSANSPAEAAVLVYLIAHALHKAGLFLVNGNLDHLLGTRDLRQLRGVNAVLPLSFAGTVGCLASSAGLPPLPGFTGKELALSAVIESPEPLRTLWLVALTVGNAFIVACALRVMKTFVSRPKLDKKKYPVESLWLIAPLALIFVAMLWISFYPISLFPGYHVKADLALGLSATSWLVGVGLFSLVGWYEKVVAFETLLGLQWFHSALAGILKFGQWQFDFFQSGKLRHDVALSAIFLFFLTVIGWNHIDGFKLIEFQPAEISLSEWLITITALLSTIVCVTTRSRVVAILALGGIGYSVALFYSIFGMPDLAVTQVAVETLSVVLFAIAFKKIPPMRTFSFAAGRITQLALAIGCGSLVFLISLAAISNQVDSRLTPYFNQNSLLLAHGRNVVNVILVDFRGLDTMGEISVLCIASLGVLAMLKHHPKEKAS